MVVRGTPQLPGLSPQITADRLSRRRSLRQQIEGGLRGLEANGALAGLERQYQQAFDLLTTAAARRAFDLSEEPPGTHDRYGRSLFGESALTVRLPP